MSGSVLGLEDKVAVVTGASQGVGLGCARQFVQAGADVVITGRRAAPLEKAAAELRGSGRSVIPVVGDAEDPELAHHLPLPPHGWVVSTVRRVDTNVALLHALAHAGYRGHVAVAAHRPADAVRLTRAGAHHVLMPYASAARDVVDLIADGR